MYPKVSDTSTVQIYVFDVALIKQRPWHDPLTVFVETISNIPLKPTKKEEGREREKVMEYCLLSHTHMHMYTIQSLNEYLKLHLLRLCRFVVVLHLVFLTNYSAFHTFPCSL